MKLVQTNKGYSLEITSRPLNKRQQVQLARMLTTDRLDRAINWLGSLNGKRAYTVVNRFASRENDTLANKPTGDVLRKFKFQTNTSYSAVHQPLNRHDDWIGIEIECFVPLSAVYLDEADHSSDRARDYLRQRIEAAKIVRCSVKYDGSLSVPDSAYFSCEVTVLTRLSRPDNLRQLCSLLNSLGAKVNKSCGLHVHLDARHLNSDQVKAKGVNFERALPVMLSMVPKSRRSNTYCKPSVSNLNGSRYHAVNLTAFSKYKTVEVRLHSGTTDFTKIFNWAVLMTSIFKASRVRKRCADLNELTEFVRIPETLLEYSQRRIDLFNDATDVPTLFQDNDAAEA